MKRNKKLPVVLALISQISMIFVGYRYINVGSTDIGNGIRVMSYNVMVWNKGILPDHEWTDRCQYLLKDIQQTQPDIIGFQEVGPKQFQWLQKKLKGYDTIITYRDDRSVSEACPIFYSKTKFNLIDSGTFWLSNTPDVMSKSWGAEYHRICTYVILKCVANGQEFAFYNTHLDNFSQLARYNGVKTIINKIKCNKNIPCIVAGDFNITTKNEVYELISKELFDTCLISKDTQNGATYHNWGNNLDDGRIDYIFCSKEFIANKFRIVSNDYDGIYPSDHFAIYSELDIYNGKKCD